MSVDGKISTGDIDERDFDKDLPQIPGIQEGLHQYYELEEQTDLYSFNSSKVLAKVGWNNQKENIEKLPVNFIIVDNQPHLTSVGIRNLCARTEWLFIVTTNKNHPALKELWANIEVIYYEKEINFIDLFEKLKTKYQVENLTVQSSEELNSVLLRNKLIDKISIVIAPALIGGRNTSTLIDGSSLNSQKDLSNIKALKFESITTLDNSYIHIKYCVKNDIEIQK